MKLCVLVHFQGVIHRDIKPANLLLSREGRVKISDFGVSHVCQGDITDEVELAKTAGTPMFFAPELCSGERDENLTKLYTKEIPYFLCDYIRTDYFKTQKIGKTIDIWALGVTLYCFIFGKCPFTADNEFELFRKLNTQK